MNNYFLDICDLGNNGEGIAHSDGKTFFVPFALPGEKVEAVLVKEKENMVFCNLKKVVEKSEDRQVAKCPYFEKCGGCDLQHLKYEKQLEFKTQLVKNTIKKVAGINAKVEPCQKSENEFCYRNKISFVVKNNKVGLLKKESHDLVEIANCPITQNFNEQLILVLNEFLGKNPNQDISHFVARYLNNVLLLTIVSKTDKIKGLNYLTKLVEEKFDNFGINININKKSDGEILSSNFLHIAGQEKISAEENGVSFSIGSGSFFQINNDVRKKLYSYVLKNAVGNVCLDAYSGAGLLSALLSKKFKKVFAVELNKFASEDAKRLFESNSIKNVKNICDDCASAVPKISKENNIDCVVLDPPRSGCDKKVLEAILNSNAKKIIYVSCNAPTLSRDLKIVCEKFEIESIVPFDMFAQTKNVETVVVLKKKSGEE